MATQIELEPDIGGVSSGSMMMKAASASRVLRRHEEVDVAEDAAARLVQDEVAQAARPAAIQRLCSQIVSPGGGRTPPTMTSPTSPSAWAEITWMVRDERIQSVRTSRSAS